MQNLEELDLGHNCLKDLFGLQFCKLSMLQKLKLNNNELSKLENLQSLVVISELDVSFNKIRVLET